MKTRIARCASLLRQLLSLMVVALCVLPATGHAVVVAMVTDLQGQATISAAGKSYAAGMLAEIEAGAQLQLHGGATLVVLYLESGDEYVFKGPSLVLFNATQPEVINGAKPEKHSPSTGNRIRIKPSGVGQGALVMRGVPVSARIRLLSLSGTRVLETQPEFRWQELQPGLKYQVELADDTGRSLYEAQVDAPSFTLPAGLQLKEGLSYTWAVSTRLPDGGKYSSLGDFSVASAELRAQALALRVEATAPVSSRVVYAAWLDQVELKDEARKYWRMLSAERRDDARLKTLMER